MDYFEIVRKRFSARAYKPDPVEPEKLAQILEAGRLAPTAVNYQAFKIVVVKTEGRREELKKIYSKEWFGEAPLVLGVCSIPDKCWRRRDGKSFSDVDAAIVMDHLILAATAVGLNTCWVGAFHLQSAREVLKLDELWEPIAFTPLGYASESSFNKVRKALKEIVVYR